jgi:type II secretory pathway pseudopilin PulG
MKLTTLVLGIVAVACAAASIYLGSELTAAREELAQAAQARGADQARIRQLESERRRWDLMASNSAPAPSGPAQPGSPPPSMEQKPVANLSPGSPPPAVPATGRPRIDDSPGAEAMRRTQQEIRLRRMYAEMPAALGLDANQADKLFNLLADSRVSTFEDSRGYAGDPAGRQAIDAPARQQRDASIDALLGPDKAAEFLAFEKSIPARMQVNRIGESMAAANAPLSDTQRNSLIAAVASEQEAFPRPERPADGRGDADYDARFLDWQAEYSRRVQARIEPLLNTTQLAQYRTAVEMQNARRANQRASAEQRRGNPGRQ